VCELKYVCKRENVRMCVKECLCKRVFKRVGMLNGESRGRETVSKWERERERIVCVWDESVCEREKGVCVCVWERERKKKSVCVCVCVCVCVWERERERERVCVCMRWECVRERKECVWERERGDLKNYWTYLSSHSLATKFNEASNGDFEKLTTKKI